MANHTFQYQRITEEVCRLIDEGILSAGTKIPSLRSMSRKMRVSIATVTHAYTQLEDQGLIESRPQSGYYVRVNARIDLAAPEQNSNLSGKPLAVDVTETVSEHIGKTKIDIVSEYFDKSINKPLLPYAGNRLNPELLPHKLISRISRKILSDHSLQCIEYSMAPGSLELRKQIAFRGADIGCRISPNDVILSCGAIEALSISIQAVTRIGDVVAVESPTYHLLLELLQHHGLLAVEIPTDPENGLDVDAFKRIIKRTPIKALVIVSNFNNPMGSLMPDENKRSLVECCSENEIPIIDDDIYGDLYRGKSRPNVLAAFDHDGWVITCSSFSKTIAPGLRCGWVIPGRFAKKILSTKRLTTSGNTTLMELTMAEYLKKGHYDRHLQKIRRILRETTQAFRVAINRYFPEGTRVANPAGGMALWVQLPEYCDALEIWREGAKEGIGLTPGALFTVSDRYHNYIRLTLGNPWSPEMEQSLKKLGGLCAQKA